MVPTIKVNERLNRSGTAPRTLGLLWKVGGLGEPSCYLEPTTLVARGDLLGGDKPGAK